MRDVTCLGRWNQLWLKYTQTCFSTKSIKIILYKNSFMLHYLSFSLRFDTCKVKWTMLRYIAFSDQYCIIYKYLLCPCTWLCNILFVYLQRVHPPRCWSRCWVLRPRRWVRHRYRGWRWRPRHRAAAQVIRRNDSYPHFRRSVGSIRSHRRHLPLHEAVSCYALPVTRFETLCYGICSWKSRTGTVVDR